ncbi:hypothetical protein IZ6_09210 [Terrihabitans soli]|uniref:Glyoxalase-related protein domain-containing protein n=1 Tax=Terrihabitans soli TaxID=708113 RepID=A0A6S6QLJ5_9HYPH|nr:glyoxalase superfamily protein [Terrihabitans soli]BCJ90186.1 hypothetical protein IZ6_09210 [Terrihabitans soli]
MRTFRDSKDMAKALRAALRERGSEFSHSDCLEFVARQLGFDNWNVLSARIEDDNAVRTRTLYLPEGWVASGTRPEFYEMGAYTAEGDSIALIRSLPGAETAKAGIYGNLMQSFRADRFRGRKLRFTGELKTEDVRGSGTLWMRVDRSAGHTLCFDNMETRAREGSLKGNQDWTRREIVLDVADDAESVHFGFYLAGTGCVWARDLEIGETTEQKSTAIYYPEQPSNLSFDRPAV